MGSYVGEQDAAGVKYNKKRHHRMSFFMPGKDQHPLSPWQKNTLQSITAVKVMGNDALLLIFSMVTPESPVFEVTVDPV